MPKLKKIILAYIPVIHSGYLKFLREAAAAGGDGAMGVGACATAQAGATELILIDGEWARNWAPTHKDLHALSSKEIKMTLKALVPELTVKIVKERGDFKKRTGEFSLICPEEVVTRGLVEELQQNGILDQNSQIEWRPVFLRWDKQKVTAATEPSADEVISEAEFDRKMMQLATSEGELSADWWRRVGAVLVRDGSQIILMTHNLHLPHEQQPNIEGDMRAQFHKGENWELTTSIHAEADLIARAAAEGIFVAGAELYVTDFPCPTCAKLIARSGIKTLYYRQGYAVSDGERILKTAGVKIVRVK